MSIEKKKHIVIIGGGLSGLSTAVYLLMNGGKEKFDVTVFESGPQLGGQAASWESRGKKEEVGIHLLFPWYANFFQLFRDIGWGLDLAQTDGNYYICNGRTGQIDILHAGVQPGTTGFTAAMSGLLKALWGLWTFPGLSKKESWWLARFIWKILRMPTEEIDRRDIPTDVFLRMMGATENLITQLSLETVTIQGLRINTASAASFIKFLKATYGCTTPVNPSFFTSPTGESLIAPLEKFILDNGGSIHVNQPVQAVEVKDGSAYMVRGQNRWVMCDEVIMAVPGYLVPPLIPAEYRTDRVFEKLSYLKSASVITLTLWYDTNWFPDHNVYISNREGVIFDAIADKARHWKDPDHCGSIVQVLIDAADDVAQWPDEQIFSKVMEDIGRFWPANDYPQRSTTPKSWSLIRHQNIYCETQWTYWRNVPRSHATPIRNLFLAGDYTAGLYHYGMESAVMSGKEVANQSRAKHDLSEHPRVFVEFLPFMKR